jgi:hypothetical protein
MFKIKNCTEAKRTMQNLHNKYEVGHIFSGEEHELLLEILTRFYVPPNNEKNVQKHQIKEFFVEEAAFKTKCIGVLINIETESCLYKTTMSAKNCKSKRLIAYKTQPKLVTSALRSAIDYQVRPHRKKGLEVDHVVPFFKIRDNFMEEHNLTYDDIKIEYNDLTKQYDIQNKDILEFWKKYHHSNFEYELVSKEENMSRYKEYKNKNKTFN